MSVHEIELEYGEEYTDFVMGMYVDTRLADDIDELGWNMCGCDDAVFQEKIGNCQIKNQTIKNGIAKISLEFFGNDLEKLEQVLEEVQSNWEDRAINLKKGLLSRA